MNILFMMIMDAIFLSYSPYNILVPLQQLFELILHLFHVNRVYSRNVPGSNDLLELMLQESALDPEVDAAGEEEVVGGADV